RRDGADAAGAARQGYLGAGVRHPVVRLHRADRLVLRAVRAELLQSRGARADRAGNAALDPGDGHGDRGDPAAGRARPRHRARRAGAQRMSASLEVAFVLVVFLGLLAAGMAIPFAIGVPAIVYLLLHGGVPALKGIGLMSWGS